MVQATDRTLPPCPLPTTMEGATQPMEELMKPTLTDREAIAQVSEVLGRTLEQASTMAAMLGRAEAKIAVLTGACGLLLNELVMRSPNSAMALEHVSGLIDAGCTMGRASGADDETTRDLEDAQAEIASTLKQLARGKPREP